MNLGPWLALGSEYSEQFKQETSSGVSGGPKFSRMTSSAENISEVKVQLLT